MFHNKVVLKFKDSKILKGVINNWLPSKESIFVHTLDGHSVNVKFENLKAVFFVKDFDGDKGHKKQYQDFIPGEGRKLKAQFGDGEVITGFSLAYSATRKGFMMTPADKASNNIKIFIIQSAVEKVESIESLDH
jgi:DNA polymerase III sliding clamp (beta) subunit (PCNA family)